MLHILLDLNEIAKENKTGNRFFRTGFNRLEETVLEATDSKMVAEREKGSTAVAVNPTFIRLPEPTNALVLQQRTMAKKAVKRSPFYFSPQPIPDG